MNVGSYQEPEHRGMTTVVGTLDFFDEFGGNRSIPNNRSIKSDSTKNRSIKSDMPPKMANSLLKQPSKKTAPF